MYHKGRQIAHVTGGVYRTCDDLHGPFKAVNSTTLFFVNSVSKGVSASAFMTFLDQRGNKKLFDSLVSAHWPEFGAGGKQEVTVEQLLSHRAGLASFGLRPSDLFRLLVHLIIFPSGGHLPLFSAMTSELESCPPAHTPGIFAAYHAISNSWIMGGLIDKLRRSKTPASINDFVHERLCDPLNLPHNSVFLGRIPDWALPNLAATEAPPIPQGLRRSKGATDEAKASPDGSLWRWFETRILGPIEAALVSGFIALPSWRCQCLPGNNGAVTAGTLGKIFGALANYGEAESHRFVSSAVVKEVAKRVKGEKNEPKIRFDHPDGEYANLTARRSCGFFPWTSPELHGAQYDKVIFSSEGMGGGFAMADPTNKLSIVCTKSVYEPLSVLGGSISVDSIEIASCVREHLGIL